MLARKPAIAILGPTASGKTKLGVAISHTYGGEVISLDSLQCYKPGGILTAKPSTEEMQGIKHHLVDYLRADQEPDNFVQLVASAMDEIHDRQKLPVLVGGSTSLTIPSLLEAHESNYHILAIILMPNKLTYPSLVRGRSQDMMEQGLINDLNNLYSLEGDIFEAKPSFDVGVWKAIGYREFYQYLQRKTEGLEVRVQLLNDAFASFILKTERYGLQQMDWITKHLLPYLFQVQSVCVPLSVEEKTGWESQVQQPAMDLVGGYLKQWN